MDQPQTLDSGAGILKNFYEPTKDKLHEALMRKKKKLKDQGVAADNDSPDDYRYDFST